jgi:2-polyprenyl-3-methyl-5-hydroxy-6-metoxy-1,4-benzoquinol methylase
MLRPPIVERPLKMAIELAAQNLPVDVKVYQNSGNTEVLRWVPSEAKTILDIGCGAGDNARALSGRSLAIDGITLSEEEAKIARQYCRNVFVHNLENGLPQTAHGPYDVILASHVLEHICFPEKLLRDISSVLSDRGVLIVALPNVCHWRNRLGVLFGKFEYTKTGIMDNTHFKWYTFLSGRRLLESHGFQVRQAYAEGIAPLWIVRKILPRGVIKSLDALMCRLSPGLFGVQLLYVATREPSSTR